MLDIALKTTGKLFVGEISVQGASVCLMDGTDLNVSTFKTYTQLMPQLIIKFHRVTWGLLLGMVMPVAKFSLFTLFIY
jgi:hypothetical protein